MTYRTYDDADYEPPQAPKRGSLFLIIIFAMLAIFGAASAFLWRACGINLTALPSFSFVSEPSAAPPANAAMKSVELQTF
jgi:hypothetical protein